MVTLRNLPPLRRVHANERRPTLGRCLVAVERSGLPLETNTGRVFKGTAGAQPGHNFGGRVFFGEGQPGIHGPVFTQNGQMFTVGPASLTSCADVSSPRSVSESA